ncbi:hypothetical protein [Ponticoccus alexandrii]|uniref:Uncharacterized protein n=1 Tax=Ponticoccus alexandrii TaxID=1943633 RepID=A0ABX7FF76_9RHOB|nr:hypothetical protein [Ponticoccus alexandrii]QRF69168.1 hypothetical protein GQA70_22760 [Ponticoccus alexandrii]
MVLWLWAIFWGNAFVVRDAITSPSISSATSRADRALIMGLIRAAVLTVTLWM